MMTIARFLMLFAAVLIGCLTSSVKAGGRSQGYIYDAVAIGDHRAIVINNITARVSIQSKSTASVDQTSSTFGGEFENCGNQIYHCITGPVDIIIPKKMTLADWQYHGVFCKSRAEQHINIYLVTCKSGVSGVETIVTFSVLRGVLSFKNTPLGGRSLFKLRGYFGIFSRPDY